MYRPRIIPVLLLKKGGLVKSIKFKEHRYIGDPINAVKIFNDLKADELAFIDIDATNENRTISTEFVKNVGEEANMPFLVGGGIRTLEQIRIIIEAGAEKVILNTIAGENPSFVNEAAREFGSSTIMVCIDVKKTWLGKEAVWIRCGKKQLDFTPAVFAKEIENAGAGEILLQSIEHDGTMLGYNIPLIQKVAENITIPITILGGAGNLQHMTDVLKSTPVNGLAAGSMFIYHGPRHAVLVNYPEGIEKDKLFFQS